MNIVLFGPPGSGKGTQSEFLVSRLGYVQISTGDLLRAAVEAGTALGKEASAFMDKGQLVPDSIVVGMVDEFIAGLQGKKFVLDGFPRTVDQAISLEKILESRHVKIGKAFFLKVDLDLIVNRVVSRRVCRECKSVYNLVSSPSKREGICDRCGGGLIQRKDDQPEVVRSRLDAYQESTSKLVDYYSKRGLSEVVNGQGTVEEVFKQIEQRLQ